jgi:hypothetical protein
MATNFQSRWINYLDELMMVWNIAYSCPSSMMVPWKPHPFGNELHGNTDSISGVLDSVPFYIIAIQDVGNVTRKIPGYVIEHPLVRYLNCVNFSYFVPQTKFGRELMFIGYTMLLAF